MDNSAEFTYARAVTASDTAPNNGNGFVVGVTGAVAIEDQGGTQTTIPVVTAGVVYRIRFNKILATGTTATGIVRLY